MKFVDEFRDPQLSKALLIDIAQQVTKKWTIMEICGGQTHAILQYGIDKLLPPEIELVHGPGCPVCVTPLEVIDKALAIASQENVIFTSFGDMLRVPGTHNDLFSVRASGYQVKVVYSPIDAVKLAMENPDKQVVFFAIGFETTAPANAMSVLQAASLDLANFSILVSQVTVPAAMHAILSSPDNRIQAFLAAGHVCTVMGYWQYVPIAEQYRVPIVVTGFEPLDLLKGISMTINQLENQQSNAQNAYSRSVTYEGNKKAQEIIDQVFEPCDRKWRGIGSIPGSGLKLREKYAIYDAEHRFQVGHIASKESETCISGQILQGLKRPFECPAFSKECTPQHPLGATMVSTEGTCAAYYQYAQTLDKPHQE